jgi:hypothetical protein
MIVGYVVLFVVGAVAVLLVPALILNTDVRDHSD